MQGRLSYFHLFGARLPIALIRLIARSFPLAWRPGSLKRRRQSLSKVAFVCLGDQIADRLCPSGRGLASLTKAEQGRSQKPVDKGTEAVESVDKEPQEVRIKSLKCAFNCSIIG